MWILTAAVALAVAAVMASRFRRPAPRLRPVEALAILAVVTMAVTDLATIWQPMRDLGIYLLAGQHYLHGGQVYLSSALTVGPDDPKNLPFLYPPLTLPFFGALSVLPERLAQVVWLVGSVGLGMLALRWIGLPWRWAALALGWPPFFIGLWVGNIAVPALALFAMGPAIGSGLVLGAIFKSYTGISALWLMRERRWVDVLVGVAALAILVLATLPLTGLDLWPKWIASLGFYQASQPNLPGLYGFGLPRYVPYPVYFVAAAVAVIAALMVRGREGLARFGTATIVASPSLFGHGLLVAVPSLLSLRSPWLWLAVGLVSTPQGPQWLLAIGVIVLSWVVPAMRRDPKSATAEEPLHPLGANGEIWPAA